MTLNLDELERELEEAEADDRSDPKTMTQVRELILLAREHWEMARVLTIIATPAGPGDTPAHLLAFRTLSKFADARRAASLPEPEWKVK